jgi:hypothetical protein
MATRASKENELLTPANLERVISLLEPEEGKPASKKDCCQILGIAYNVTRLATLIEKYKADKERNASRRAALRGKPATLDETVFIIAEYLEGNPVDAISKSTFRSAGLVKSVLDSNSVPIRQPSQDYFKPELIPEGAMRNRFAIGEVVYSARYDSIARIDTETLTEKYGYIYRIWLLSERWMQSANQEACELASLEHLRKLGVRV